ncbi:MAG TPA: hypothetical protein VMA30_22815 [Xanthobacteraceae bacterium]|nr:hypothetical protein [Xanthobacteraceae bacterium]
MTERPAARQPQTITRSASPALGAWSRFKEFAVGTDLELVVALCLIGLLITLNLMFRFPELGAVIAQCNQF